MGNINISNISCNYNVCLDDLYEVDWFSEKNWKIYISNEEYRNNYIIKKGKFILSNMKDVNIILNRHFNFFALQQFFIKYEHFNFNFTLIN